MRSLLTAFWTRLSPAGRTLLVAGALALPLSVGIPALLQQWSLRIAGLPRPRHHITVAVLAPTAFNARADQARIASSTPVARCQRLALVELGLVSGITPALTPATASPLDRLVETPTATALYATGSDTIFTTAADHPSVRHEYVHAVEDQLGDRLRAADAAGTTDARLALRGAIEGTAMLATGAVPPSVAPVGEMDHDAWVFLYTLAPLYVRRASNDQLERALALRPRTTYEVLFERARTPIALAPAPVAAGNRIVCTDALGALGVLTAALGTGTPVDAALALARSWMGDRMDIMDGTQGRRVAWTVAFSDSSDAAAWLRGPGHQLHLTAPRTALLTVVSRATRTPSPLDSLGR